MSSTVVVRGQFMEYVYICRAIFHTVVANGTGLSIFSKLHMENNGKNL